MKNNRISNVYPSLVEMATGTISELVIVNIAVYHVHFLWISEDMDWDRRNTQDYVYYNIKEVSKIFHKIELSVENTPCK